MSAWCRVVVCPIALAAALGAWAAEARQDPAADAEQEDPAPAEPVAEEPSPADTYTYSPAGRRDPFVSLVATGQDVRPDGVRLDGVAGLLINEVTVRGIIQSQGQFLAMIQAPDNRTYIIRAEDRLLDGTVRDISADTVIFLQEVNDPLSLVKEREVGRSLRVEEGL